MSENWLQGPHPAFLPQEEHCSGEPCAGCLLIPLAGLGEAWPHRPGPADAWLLAWPPWGSRRKEEGLILVLQTQGCGEAAGVGAPGKRDAA